MMYVYVIRRSLDASYKQYFRSRRFQFTGQLQRYLGPYHAALSPKVSATRSFFSGLCGCSSRPETHRSRFNADLHDRSRNSDQPWSGDWYQSSGGFRRHERYRSSSTSDTAIGYAHGDPDSVPSVYMDYDKALALGKEMLEQRSLPSLTPSLGDVARALRQSSNHPAPDGKTSSTIRIPPNL
jgi:hypothetical protein